MDTQNFVLHAKKRKEARNEKGFCSNPGGGGGGSGGSGSSVDDMYVRK